MHGHEKIILKQKPNAFKWGWYLSYSSLHVLFYSLIGVYLVFNNIWIKKLFLSVLWMIRTNMGFPRFVLLIQVRFSLDWGWIIILNLIGFLTGDLYNQTTDNTSLSFKDYKKGNWSNDKFTGDELYYKVTPDVSDLLKEIVIKRMRSKEGDAYDNVNFPFSKGVSNNHTEIKFTRKDYYSTFRNYCLHLRLESLQA